MEDRIAIAQIRKAIKRDDLKISLVAKRAGISRSLFYKVIKRQRTLTPETRASLFLTLNINPK